MRTRRVATTLIGPLRHENLSDRVCDRAALSLQHLNLPQLQHNLFGLILLPGHLLVQPFLAVRSRRIRTLALGTKGGFWFFTTGALSIAGNFESGLSSLLWQKCISNRLRFFVTNRDGVPASLQPRDGDPKR